MAAFELPLLSFDYDHAQSLDDLINVLDGLNKVVEDVFGRLSKRIAEEKNRVAGINDHITTCVSKVNSVRGITKATTIFSSARFPGPRYPRDFRSLYFDRLSPVDPAYPEPEDDKFYSLAEHNESVSSNPALDDETVYIQSKVFSYNINQVRPELIMDSEGLGKAPITFASSTAKASRTSRSRGYDPSSVSDLLLFNSRQCPYKSYSSKEDNLESSSSSSKARTNMEEDSQNKLTQQALALLSGDILPQVEGLDFSYKPQLGTMEAFELPDNLPLPDVASNVSWSAAQVSSSMLALPSIAPSNFQEYKSLLPATSLPALMDYAPTPSAKQPNKPTTSLSSSNNNSSSSSSSVPPPPPPVRPMPPTNDAANPPPPVARPPPPPVAAVNPPPAVTAIPITTVTQPAVAVVVQPARPSVEPSSSSSSGGMSLMDAIRGADLTKLKKAEETKLEEANDDEDVAGGSNSAQKPMSMLEEMRAKMKARNDALSGKRDRLEQRRESIKYSATINLDDDDDLSITNRKNAKPTSTSTLSSISSKPPAPARKTSVVVVDDDDEDDDEDDYFEDDDEDGGKKKQPPTLAPLARSQSQTPSSSTAADDKLKVKKAGAVRFSESVVSKPTPPSSSSKTPTAIPSSEKAQVHASKEDVDPSMRSSLFDSSNPQLNKMLAAGKKVESDKSRDEDWD